MKKSKILFAALAMVSLAACGGGDKKAADTVADDSKFAETQPVVSGEYRATSFEYVEADAKRNPFDGRVLFALDEKNSAFYVYENGNRTNFKALVSLAAPFAKQDSVYTATTLKGQPVSVLPGKEGVDTLVFVKSDKTVKVAFEKKPMKEIAPIEALQRITEMAAK